MESIFGFIWDQLADARVTAALILVLGFLCRSQVLHWMNRDLEEVKSRYSRQLEEEKALYQRELEAYRTSLIAQTEAIKAAQDVKRSMAIAMTAKQIEAMHSLQAAFTGRCVQLFTLFRRAPAMEREERVSHAEEWVQYLQQMKAAARDVTAFARDELQTCLTEIQIQAASLAFSLHEEKLAPRSPEEVDSFMNRMFELQRKFDSELREYVERIQGMKDS